LSKKNKKSVKRNEIGVNVYRDCSTQQLPVAQSRQDNTFETMLYHIFLPINVFAQ